MVELVAPVPYLVILVGAIEHNNNWKPEGVLEAALRHLERLKHGEATHERFTG